MADVMSTSALLIMFATSLASIGTLLVLFERHIGGKPLLNYEFRQRVPWRAGIVLVMMILTFSGVALTLAAIANDHEEQAEVASAPEVNESTRAEAREQDITESSQVEEQANSLEFIVNSLGFTAFSIMLVVAVGGWLNISVGASPVDLGLPTSGEQVLQDIKIGCVACVASLLPIYVLQIVLISLFEPQLEHPLIERLSENHSPAMLLAGFLLAVVAAPLSEEFIFRLVLQGWLERWEDETIGYTGSMRPHIENGLPEMEVPGSEFGGDRSHSFEEKLAVLPDQTPAPQPGSGVLSSLPHGWLPILISGTLFGLAHLGHGVSPIPLVLFGVVLGYLYQRTHRLVPSITAHALFNAYSMIMLWLQLGD